jgi:hypothetical protein
MAEERQLRRNRGKSRGWHAGTSAALERLDDTSRLVSVQRPCICACDPPAGGPSEFAVRSLTTFVQDAMYRCPMNPEHLRGTEFVPVHALQDSHYMPALDFRQRKQVFVLFSALAECASVGTLDQPGACPASHR